MGSLVLRGRGDYVGGEERDDGMSPWRRWEGVEVSHDGEEGMLEGDLQEEGVLLRGRGRWEVERGVEVQGVGGVDDLGSMVECERLEGSLVDYSLFRSKESKALGVRTWLQLGENSRVLTRMMRRLIGHRSIVLNRSFRDDRMVIERDLDVWDVVRFSHDHSSIHSYVHSNVFHQIVENAIYDLVRQRSSTIRLVFRHLGYTFFFG
jgi:hypothetical protein